MIYFRAMLIYKGIHNFKHWEIKNKAKQQQQNKRINKPKPPGPSDIQ